MSAPDDVPEFCQTDACGDLSTPAEDLQAEPNAQPYPDLRASSPDHPSIAFVQAAGYTVGRPDGKPLWIVMHDMEARETSQTAENTAAYFANPPDGRNVSSHYTVDDDSVVQCVRLKDSAWTVGNRPGNNRGINWELAGFASQTRTQWLDAFGLAMFAQIRPILRSDAAKFGIPLTRRTVAELRAWKPGITSHNDLRLAFGGTTHTDPGPNFPWDVFLQMMNQGDHVTDPFQNMSKYASSDGATRTQDQKIQDIEEIVRFGRNFPSWLVNAIGEIKAEQVKTNQRLSAIEAILGQAPPPGQVVVARTSVEDIALETVSAFGRELTS
jgi:N-acetyl-anhydromuramyl-L-alanine amidase AmpD